uniref:Uncharacterized mitochondrial protein AtMg00810-like n=1 Tax=Tanacetum cinerariifolium TaxID=118510 RepID=A0A6L2KFQ2_TANCI|nr:uncharacterized mitochondrial protein AtMg00810-like [Tanacetum cinerariifolium]
MNDLYNNLKVYEDEIKGKSSSCSNSHNVAFVSSKNTSSINKTVNAAPNILAADSKEQPFALSYADDVMFSFFGNKSADNERRVIPVETRTSALVVQDGLDRYDWSYQAEEGPIDFALMAHSSDSANSLIFESIKNASDSSVSEIDEDNNQVKDRYKVGIEYHAVPPSYTGNYMPLKADLSFARLDDYVFKFKISETRTSVNEIESIASKSSEEIREVPKTVQSSAPIIEDWESDSEDEYEDKTSTKQEISSNDNSVKSVECTGQREVRPVWNNARSVNHQNFSKMTHPHPKRNFVPTAVATKSGQVLVNAAKQNSIASTSTARPKVNTAAIRPNVNAKSSYFKPHFPKRMYFYQRSAAKTNTFSIKINTAKGKIVTTAGPKAVVNAADRKKENVVKNSAEYQEIDGGFVAFRGSPKGVKITGKGKIRTGKLDFEDVYFMKELKFNIFSVSQISPNLESMKPFGCPVTILITLDYLDVNAGDQPGDVNVGDQPGDVNAGNQPGDVNAGDIQGDVDEISRNDDVSTGIFDGAFDDKDLGAKADTNNLDSSTVVNPILTTRVYKDHPKEQIIRNPNLKTQTRRMINFSKETAMMSSMGELTFFLGLQVKQNQDGIFINQDKYVAKILKKFRFSKVKTTSTLMETSKPLLKDEDGQENRSRLLWGYHTSFDFMMVQAATDMGDTPVESHQTSIVDQPSTFKPHKPQKPRRKQRKEAETSHGESEDEDHIPTPSSDPLPSGEDSSILNELMGRMIEEIDQNAEIALDDKSQGRTNDDEMFGVDDLAKEEVVMDRVANPVTTVKDSTASTTDDKGKAKIIKPEVPLKKKEQMRIDEEYARKLQAKEQEATRLSRAQQDKKANNSWDNMQAMMDADRLLAERL